MIGTQDHINEIVWRYYMPRKFFVVILTTKCPVGCRHCMRKCTMNDVKEMTDTVNEAALRGMTSDWLVGTSGGEPILHPTLLKKTVERARYNGQRVAMATSGYWVDDPISKKFILDDLAIDYVVISVDAYHNEKIPIEKLNKFARDTAKKQSIVIGNLMITNLPTPEAIFASLPFPLIECGRAVGLKNDVAKFVGDFSMCESPGVIVETNGNVFGGCYAHMGSCVLGQLPQNTVRELLARCYRPRFHVLGGKISSTSEICHKIKNRIDDKKWADPHYYEEVDIRTWKVTPKTGPVGNEIEAVLKMSYENIKNSGMWDGWRQTYPFFL